MCVVSYVGDYYRDTLPAKPYWPTIQPFVSPPPSTVPIVITNIPLEEFNALKRDVEELKLLLKAAKRFDEKTGQPDCETESKVALIKKLAELVGVDMNEIFPSGT